jgi:hypothetical protein
MIFSPSHPRPLTEAAVNLNVELAGCRFPWRFRDFAPLDAWLAECPWLNEGGVCLVRVSSSASAPDLADAIRRAILAHDENTSEVSVQLLPAELARPPFGDAVAHAFGLAPGLSRREQVRLAARVLAHRPAVFLFEGPPPGADDLPPRREEVFAEGEPPRPRALVHAEAIHFLEQVSREENAPPATVIFFDTPRHPLGSTAHDLSVGGPTQGVLAEGQANEPALWRAYLHTRLAWEAAGDLGRARAWDECGFATLPLGNDEALEKLLNRCAENDCDALPDFAGESVREYFTLLVQPDTSSRALADRAADLLDLGLLWQPPGDRLLRPTPWLARALLLRREAEDVGYLLRGCLVCNPLARELFGRCFDLETRARALAVGEWRGDPLPPAPSLIQERFDAFMAADPRSEYCYYPSGCPAAPADAWPFATFGEVLHLLRPTRLHEAFQNDLRNLRNALAHGHYVNWHAVTLVRRIEAVADH